MKLTEIPLTLGLEFAVAILSLLALFIPSKWVVNKIKKINEKKKRLENLDTVVIGKIGNIEETVNEISREVKVLSARQIAMISMDETPTFICDEGGKCIFANSELCAIFGAQLASMLGFGWSSYILEEDRERALKEWTLAVENDVDVTNKYRIRQGGTSEIIPLKYRAIIARDKSGEVTHIVGSVFLDNEA